MILEKIFFIFLLFILIIIKYCNLPLDVAIILPTGFYFFILVPRESFLHEMWVFHEHRTSHQKKKTLLIYHHNLIHPCNF